MIVDAHAHVVGDDEIKYPFMADRPNWPFNTGDALVAAMDQATIGKALLVQSYSTYGFDNSYMIDTVLAHRDRMLGVCVLDALARNAAETLTQFVAKNAVRGLRLLNDGRRAKTAIDDPRTFALWEVATKLGLPVCVASSIDEVSRLSTVLARFPGASIVFDEISGKDKSFPATTDRLAALVALAAHENFFVKITPEMSLVLRNEKTPPEKFYAPLVEKFGANRLMWGSHYPVRVSAFGDIAARLEAAKTDLAFLGNIERRWIFSETAFSLWPQLRA